MGQKMSWEEMQQAYPDEWLLITDFELDQYGKIVTGVVERHSTKRDALNEPALVDKDTAARYTGQSTFLGLRSHVTNQHIV